MTKLDRFDVAILDALQRDGRMTRLKLSEIVGLSQTPCHERVKRLEKEELITSYSAEIEISSLMKISFVHVTIVLGSHRAVDFDAFEAQIQKCPEVVECLALGGAIDYIIKLVAKNEEDYEAFMQDLMARDLGIAEYKGHFITKSVKKHTGAPLGHLFSEQENS